MFPHHHHVLIICNSLVSGDSLSQPQLCSPAGQLSLMGAGRGPAHSSDPVQVWLVVHLQQKGATIRDIDIVGITFVKMGLQDKYLDVVSQYFQSKWSQKSTSTFTLEYYPAPSLLYVTANKQLPLHIPLIWSNISIHHVVLFLGIWWM